MSGSPTTTLEIAVFKKLFAALAALTANTEGLAADVAEARTLLRTRLGLDDGPDDVLPALPEPQRNGRRLRAADTNGSTH